MTTELLFALTALLLSLFCLICSARTRRELYFPMPKGLPAKLKNRHAVYFFMLGTLMIAAVLSGAATVCQNMEAAPGLNVLQVVFIIFQAVFFFGLACYAADMPGSRKSGKFLGSASRLTVIPIAAAAAAGVVIQLIWSVRVAVFFEAAAMFACMILTEEDENMRPRGSGKRFQGAAALMIVLMLAVMIVVNVTMLLNLSNTQIEEIGNVQLDVICSDLQDTIKEAESDLMRVALDTEQLLESNVSFDELTEFFYGERDKYQSNDSFMNTYVAGSDWYIVPDFDAPEDFHASERIWYIGAKDSPGEIYISEPYKDANTGNMCFTVSTLLSDGETVVAMDLNFSKVQELILQMTQGSDQTAMIVTDDGLIVGYTDMSYVGESAEETLPEYANILKRVMSSQEHDSFRIELDGRSCIVFSAETSNNWYLILSVDAEVLYGESTRQIVTLASVNLLMLAIVVIYYHLSSRRIRRAEETMTGSREQIVRFSEQLHGSASRLLRLGDIRLLREGEDPAELVGKVRESGEQLSMLADEFSSYSEVTRRAEEAQRDSHNRSAAAGVPSRKVRNGVIAALLISLVVVLVFCISITLNWGTTRMEREADAYDNQLGEWFTAQKSILYMFTDVISTQPEILDDYENAVHWLNDIVEHYPDIALCYMANPYAEHPVIMNNGWEPGEDFRPETRPWYQSTERSPDGFSISEPYLDAQSGSYCITLARIVYGEKGDFLGIFGIDYFFDDLIQVLDSSYTSDGYAFLVDSEGVIVNHPNSAYQMGESSPVSIEDTEYAEAYNREGVTALTDYSGRRMACLSRTTDSGFTIITAAQWWNIYGSVVFVTIIFIVLFGICLIFIVSLINRLIRWQENVNRQLVEAAETAQNASLSKSRFLSQMSHEIRTPMNAIIGLDNIALRDTELPEHTREELEKIGASARHLLSLINDILDMSRIESGRMVLKEERFSFRDLLEQIGIIVGGQCEEKGLRFVCNKNTPLDDAFIGDDLKLKQVLINILGNSVKFTEAPGVVTFSVEQTDGPDDSALLRFTIEDTGIGIDKEYLPRLFEAFSMEDSGNTTRYGGSGLGMAISKSIVEMMHGEIAVESEKGLGTTFTVTVSLKRTHDEENAAVENALSDHTSAADAAADHENAPDESISLEGLHVLIAEDNELNAEILIDLLDLEDMTSEWADNGQKAVEVFAGSEKGHFDAVLMDMRMPVMDGLTATQEIRKLDHPDAASIPIIALTANAFEENVKQCLDAGMNAHLSKPVDIDLLKETLARLLAENR